MPGSTYPGSRLKTGTRTTIRRLRRRDRPGVEAIDLDEHADSVVAAVLVGLAEVVLRETVDVREALVFPELDSPAEERELVVPVGPEHRERDVRVRLQVPKPEAATIHRQEHAPVRFEAVPACGRNGQGV
jgi:hypothetical protein